MLMYPNLPSSTNYLTELKCRVARDGGKIISAMGVWFCAALLSAIAWQACFAQEFCDQCSINGVCNLPVRRNFGRVYCGANQVRCFGVFLFFVLDSPPMISFAATHVPGPAAAPA